MEQYQEKIFKPGQYSFAISYDDIRHIYNEHYKTPDEIINAICRIYDMISDYDSVEYNSKFKSEEWKNKQHGNRLTFRKGFDDAEYLTVEIPSKKRRAFDLVTI